MQKKPEKPPSNTRRIMRVADLPPFRSPRGYWIENGDGEALFVILDKRKRQVLDLLRQSPVYCASPVRLSDVVFVLKRDCGLDVATDFYPGDPDIGTGTYGVYTLKSRVRGENEAVAAE